jgi:hypothetical protein
VKHWKRVRDIFLEVVIAVALVTGGSSMLPVIPEAASTGVV